MPEVDRKAFGESLWIEASAPDEDLAVLSLLAGSGSAWIEAVLRSDCFASVQHADSATIVAVAASFLKRKEPPPGASVDPSWAILHARRSKAAENAEVCAGAALSTPLFVVMVLGRALDDYGVPWRTVATVGADARVLVRRRDLCAAAAALARSGHAVAQAPLRLALPRDGNGLPDPEAAGAWSLVRSEDPIGEFASVKEYGDPGSGPLRLQARCGLFVEVRLSVTHTEVAAHASRAGRHGVVVDGGRRVSIRHTLVDFRPPTCEQLREVVVGEGQSMDVAALPPARHRELWMRLGSAEEIVALELADDAQGRVGCWIFCGGRFARVVGRPPGAGIVAGTCCASLANLVAVKGLRAVELELRANYQAIEGVVERPGRLRIRRDAWRPDLAGTLLYSSEDTAVGGMVSVVREDGVLVHRLPGGEGEQKWRIREWTFNPFMSVPSTATLENHTEASIEAKSVGEGGDLKSRSRTRSQSSSPASHGSSQLKKKKQKSKDKAKDKDRDKKNEKDDSSDGQVGKRSRNRKVKSTSRSKKRRKSSPSSNHDAPRTAFKVPTLTHAPAKDHHMQTVISELSPKIPSVKNGFLADDEAPRLGGHLSNADFSRGKVSFAFGARKTWSAPAVLAQDESAPESLHEEEMAPLSASPAPAPAFVPQPAAVASPLAPRPPAPPAPPIVQKFRAPLAASEPSAPNAEVIAAAMAAAAATNNAPKPAASLCVPPSGTHPQFLIPSGMLAGFPGFPGMTVPGSLLPGGASGGPPQFFMGSPPTSFLQHGMPPMSGVPGGIPGGMPSGMPGMPRMASPALAGNGLQQPIGTKSLIRPSAPS